MREYLIVRLNQASEHVPGGIMGQKRKAGEIITVPSDFDPGCYDKVIKRIRIVSEPS